MIVAFPPIVDFQILDLTRHNLKQLLCLVIVTVEMGPLRNIFLVLIFVINKEQAEGLFLKSSKSCAIVQ